MTMDEAEARAATLWCKSARSGRTPAVWTTAARPKAGIPKLFRVGFRDGEFRYCMGAGETWEEAFKDAEYRTGYRSMA